MSGLFLYIDPGTGSMLFSLFIGLATTAVFGIRALSIKLKAIVGRGKQTELDKSHLGIMIYSDSKRYWNVFGPIAHEFENRKIPLTYFTQSSDDPALSEKFEYVKTEFIGEGNKGFAKMNFLNADICLSTTPGLDVLQWKRSKLCKYYVHIPHMLSDMTGYRMFGLDYYDAVLCTGDYQKNDIQKLEEIRGTEKKEFVTVGYPPMDEMKKRLDSVQKSSSENGIKTVLVAPSWGKSGILSKYGEKFLEALKSTGYKVVVRPHPQSLSAEKDMIDRLMKKFPDSENFEWNFDNDNFNCMNNASILISDFSGIIFEFTLLFDKPVIYADTNFDKAPYDASWIDGEMWQFKTLPLLGEKLSEEKISNIKDVIDETIANDKYAEGRKIAREQAWQNPGDSVNKIVDYLVEKQKSLAEEK